MKKIMIIAAAILFTTNAMARKACVAPFEQVTVNVPATVRLVQGDAWDVIVRSTDPYTRSQVRYTVADGVLSITSSLSADELAALCITIVSPTAPEIAPGRDTEIMG